MWRNDVKLAGRRLKQQPGFTAVAIAALALGLGVNTAIFTIANVALGADRVRVVTGVMRGALMHAAMGVVAGGVAAYFAARLVGSFLYDIGTRDPLVLGVSIVILVVSAAGAAALPALRASRISPSQALRAD